MRVIAFFWLCLLLPYCLLAQTTKTELPDFIKNDLEAYAKNAMESWEVPGLAIAIVKDGQIVYAKGFGTRRLGRTEPVNANTMFMVASNTKAFTGSLLATLAEEKKINLDASIHTYLPNFHLNDSLADQFLTIRDLLSHRTGTMTFQGDLTFWDSDYTSKEIMERYGRLEPQIPFRSKFGYCNTCFLAAGEVIPAVTDTSWADMVRSRIFSPLGMNRTVALSSEFTKQDNRADAHTWYAGKLVQVKLDNIDNLGPAASICSSVNDMAKWLIMQMDTGRYDGKQILPNRAIKQTWQGQNIMNVGSHPTLPMHFWAYGLGWVLNDYAGRLMISHTGGANGFVSSSAFLPEERLGIVVLTNSDANSLYVALRYQILDAFLNRPFFDHAEQMLAGDLRERANQANKILDYKKRVAKQLKATLDLEKYVGIYEHPVYGPMRVHQGGEKLFADFLAHAGNSAVLEPMGENEFLATYSKISWGVFPMPFEVVDGEVIACTVKGNDFIEYGSYRFLKK